MSKDDTLNIYEVLELLNKKINSNTSLIEKTNLDTLESISEVKLYLLEKLNTDLKKTNSSLNKRLDDFKKAIYKNLNQQQQDLVAKEFTNLRNNVSQDMEDLVDRIMNSRIL
tara:strand:+ start:120 stop:455 length:336 start_codon:yes stop_codon:yes gene_type:complete